jgi:hypothetical protein
MQAPELRGPFEVHTLPSGKVVCYRDSDHRYFADCYEDAKGWHGRDSLPGASTIAKCIDADPGGLMHWAWKLGQEGKDHRTERDERADSGTRIHELIFAALGRGGEVPSLSALNEQERGKGQAAFRFWRENAPKPIAVEQAIVDPFHGFAGRFDLLGDLTSGEYAGARALTDAKTKDRRPDGTYFDALANHVQIAGYRLGAEVSGFPKADIGLILYLFDDGSYELVESQADKSHFLAALNVYRAKSELGKAVRAAARERVAA